MCPTNSKHTLCYHATADLAHLFPPATPTQPPPLQIFCRQVVVATISQLTAVVPTINPDTLGPTLRSVRPGRVTPNLLYSCRLWESMYHNGPDLFKATCMCYIGGVEEWVNKLVQAGMLRRRRMTGPGVRLHAEEWEWDRVVVEEWRRDEAVLGRWVWENIWREEVGPFFLFFFPVRRNFAPPVPRIGP